MARYIANTPVTLHCGVLELTNAQAAARAHNLRALGDGRFEILRPVQFKAGEEFGYDGEAPKTLLSELSTAEPAEPKKPKAKMDKTESDPAAQ